MVTVESWKPIPGWEGLYEASDVGRIRSVSRMRTDAIGRSFRMRGRVLQPGMGRTYPYVTLSVGGRTESLQVHQLVLLAFVGPRPEDREVAHNDGDHLNNRLSNLRYATHRENVADRALHGTENRGGRNPNARLTESDVRLIRARVRAGERSEDVAKDFRIHPHTARGIASGRKWAWLTDDENEAA